MKESEGKVMKKTKLEADLKRYPGIKELYNVPMEQWPRLHYELESIDSWPKELGTPPSNALDRFNLANAMAFHIEVRCGIKACSRYSSVVIGGYPDQMFDDWWDSLEDIEKKCKEPDESSSKRFRKQCAGYGRKTSKFPIVRKLFSLLHLVRNKKI